MMLMLSVVLGIVPLLGVVWIVLRGNIGTVDGLFMTLILLPLSGILFLNAYLDLRGRLKAKTATSPLAAGKITTPGTQTPSQLPHHKVKIKKAGQRACNEKNEKGKFCGGHLKRWFYSVDLIEQDCGDAEKAWGLDAEVYRCEHCKTLYLPHPGESVVNVAGQGQISVFGLTVPPKES
ncbi:MAG: hypothetical protein ABSA80_10440 [Terriglobales bacterium]|jgi:hypothetical protein